MLGTMVLILCFIYLTLETFYFFFRVFEARQRRKKLRYILQELSEAVQKLKEDKENQV